MKYFKTAALVLLLTFTSSMVFSSCSKKEKPKPKGEKTYATADVAIGNGITFSFKSDFATVVSATGTILGLNFLDKEKGISIYLSLQDHEGVGKEAYSVSIKEATQNKEAAASVVMRPVDTDLFPENFDSKTRLDDDIWNESTGNITITSIEGNWVEGTFSVTIYSESGNEARITNGKFRAKVDYEF